MRGLSLAIATASVLFHAIRTTDAESSDCAAQNSGDVELQDRLATGGGGRCLLQRMHSLSSNDALLSSEPGLLKRGPQTAQSTQTETVLPIVHHSESEVRARHWAAEQAAEAVRILGSISGDGDRVPVAVLPPPLSTAPPFLSAAGAGSAADAASPVGGFVPFPKGEQTEGRISSTLAPEKGISGHYGRSTKSKSIDDASHHSIFALRFATLDDPAFWVIMAGMICFTIVVDRVEAFAAMHARYSKTEQMFLARVNSELMLFGCIGLSLFIFSNVFAEIPQHYYLLFEFADILCSLGACGMVLMALILYLMRHRSERRWRAFELEFVRQRTYESEEVDSSEYEASYVKDPTSEPASTIEAPEVSHVSDPPTIAEAGAKEGASPLQRRPSVTEAFTGVVRGVRKGIRGGLGLPVSKDYNDYQFMARIFRQDHDLPDDFDYSMYLAECLARNACDMMDVKLAVWVSLLACFLGGLVLNEMRKSRLTSLHYLECIAALNWASLFAHLFVYYVVRFRYTNLHLECRAQREKANAVVAGLQGGLPRVTAADIEKDLEKTSTSSDDSAEVIDNSKAEEWVKRVKCCMQCAALGNSFLGAFYIMHVQHNIVIEHRSWTWSVIMVAPLVLSMFVTPATMTHLTVVQAFLSPDQDAIDSILDSHSRFEEDMRFLREIWQQKGRPSLADFSATGRLDEEGLGRLLRHLGLYVGAVRLCRLFGALDINNDGRIDTSEFFTMLTNGNKTPRSERARSDESHGSLTPREHA